MDHFVIPVWLEGLSGAWLVLGAGVYLYLGRLVGAGGGKVSYRQFERRDLILCAMFLAWFGMNVASGFNGPERAVTAKGIMEGALLYAGIVVFIGGFLAVRGINPLRQFGILQRNAFLCIALAGGLLVCAYPLVLVAERLTEVALNGNGRPQNIVQYFLNVSESSDQRAMYLTIFMAVVVAPCAEETIFRGYIYGVLKRYAGPAVATLVSAGLFAAMHLSLSSLPGLFVLALCFTLAYEATGSLLVNILMHALFNL
ncbi:MAG: type II CAAX endopeptidase family protein, partial [Chthoniobacteraceae bacterium]